MLEIAAEYSSLDTSARELDPVVSVPGHLSL